MTEYEFRILLDLCMVSDPWPLSYGKEEFDSYLDSIALTFGYADWIDAYHGVEV